MKSSWIRRSVPEHLHQYWVNLNDVAVACRDRGEKKTGCARGPRTCPYFPFRAIKSNLPFGTLTTAPVITGSLDRGIAQYLTGPGMLPGRQSSAHPSTTGSISFRDGEGFLNGQLIYASGNASAAVSLSGSRRYPPSAKILAYRDSLLSGRITVQNFSEGFEEVTGGGNVQSLFEDEWRRHMNIYNHTPPPKWNAGIPSNRPVAT